MRSVLFFLPAAVFLASGQQPQASSRSWIEESNKNAQLLLTVEARYAPEGAGSLGVTGLDDKISIPAPDLGERSRRDTEEALKTLRSRLASEPDPLVKQDLEILIQAGERENRLSLAEEKYLLPYRNIGRTIFFGEQSLLDDQIAPERRHAAVTRLRRYTGLEAGYTPITLRAENVFRDKLKTPGLLGPAKPEVEQDIANMGAFSTGIGLLLEKYKTGWLPGSLRKAQRSACRIYRFPSQGGVAESPLRFPPAAGALRPSPGRLRRRLHTG